MQLRRSSRPITHGSSWSIRTEFRCFLEDLLLCNYFTRLKKRLPCHKTQNIEKCLIIANSECLQNASEGFKTTEHADSLTLRCLRLCHGPVSDSNASSWPGVRLTPPVSPTERCREPTRAAENRTACEFSERLHKKPLIVCGRQTLVKLCVHMWVCLCVRALVEWTTSW